ncbi:MAG: ABC transporter permease [Anaerolineales bacterium]|jgi:molybdate transport system permease protein|nr:ABC transporter permease [Anaerolineales bacterium]
MTAFDEQPPGRRLRRDIWLQLFSLPILAFISLPLLALFLRVSPAQLLRNLQQPQVLQAIGLSVGTSLAATLITILLGTPLAYALARRAFRYQRLIDTLIDLPIVLPPAVAGVALLVAFGRRGLFGGLLTDLGISIAFSTAAVIMAQIFIAAPFYVKAARIGFAAIDWELEQAAGLDGANPWQVFRFVIIPLSWTALLGGSVMTWARAMGEFGATIIFAGNFPGRTQTMPLAIYLGFELDLNIALTLSVILVLFSFLVLMLVKGLLQRELTAL